MAKDMEKKYKLKSRIVFIVATLMSLIYIVWRMFFTIPTTYGAVSLVFGIILLNVFRGISQWNKNNHSPRLTVDATVVSKRQHTSHHHHKNHTSHSTTYYVTFQVVSGDRMEFHVSGVEYGQLMEGDRGELQFQGTRYLSFTRE